MSEPTDLLPGTRRGVCKVCGEIKDNVDCMGYCSQCFPYGEACDAYKRSKEGEEVDLKEWAKIAREINSDHGRRNNICHVNGRVT